MTRVFGLLMLAFFQGACATPIVKGTLFQHALQPGASASSLAIAKDESVVVLSPASITADNSWPAACVRDSIASADSSIRVMTGAEFRDATFPWFETPSIETAVAELKTMPQLAPRIQQIGVRYIIVVGGQTTTSSLEEGGWSAGGGGGGGGGGFYIGKHGLMLCGAGPGAAGCLGFMAWQRTSDLSAFVWDLKRGTQVASIAAAISGATLLPAFVLPLPLVAPTETAACNELSAHIARFVTTGKVPESTEDASTESEKQSPEAAENQKE